MPDRGGVMKPLDHPMRGCHCAEHEKLRTRNREYMRQYYRRRKARPVKPYRWRGLTKPTHSRRGCYCPECRAIRAYEWQLINEKNHRDGVLRKIRRSHYDRWIDRLDREVDARIAKRLSKPTKRTVASKETLADLKIPGDTLRVKIEQLIAQGLTNAEVMRRTGCTYEDAHATRVRMDRLAAA